MWVRKRECHHDLIGAEERASAAGAYWAYSCLFCGAQTVGASDDEAATAFTNVYLSAVAEERNT